MRRENERGADDAFDEDNEDENGISLPAHAQADWVPEAAVEALNMERTLHEDETNEQMSRRLLREAAPIITQGIINTAIRGSTDRVRLDAQKYVLDRVLGKVGDDSYEDNKSPLEKLTELLTRDAEEYANSMNGAGSNDQDK